MLASICCCLRVLVSGSPEVSFWPCRWCTLLLCLRLRAQLKPRTMHERSTFVLLHGEPSLFVKPRKRTCFGSVVEALICATAEALDSKDGNKTPYGASKVSLRGPRYSTIVEFGHKQHVW